MSDQPLRDLVRIDVAVDQPVTDLHRLTVDDGETGFEEALHGGFDVIVLDIMLPRRSGFRVCQDLRAAGMQTPLLMLTAKEGDWDEVEGLDVGADDFLRKPFERASRSGSTPNVDARHGLARPDESSRDVARTTRDPDAARVLPIGVLHESIERHAHQTRDSERGVGQRF